MSVLQLFVHIHACGLVGSSTLLQQSTLCFSRVPSRDSYLVDSLAFVAALALPVFALELGSWTRVGVSTLHLQTLIGTVYPLHRARHSDVC